MAEGVVVDLPDNLDTVDTDAEHPAVGAVAVANDCTRRQDVSLDLAIRLVAGFQRSRRAGADRLRLLKYAAVRVVLEASAARAIADAGQPALARVAASDIVVTKDQGLGRLAVMRGIADRLQPIAFVVLVSRHNATRVGSSLEVSRCVVGVAGDAGVGTGQSFELRILVSGDGLGDDDW